MAGDPGECQAMFVVVEDPVPVLGDITENLTL
jgi:hypothetical protein